MSSIWRWARLWTPRRSSKRFHLIRGGKSPAVACGRWEPADIMAGAVMTHGPSVTATRCKRCVESFDRLAREGVA
jgi:hypothetical protein